MNTVVARCPRTASVSPAVMSRAQVQDFLTNDTHRAMGGTVAVWWTEAGELLVATADRAVAALAADEVVRTQLADPLVQVFGGVAVDEPMSVELIGEPGGQIAWQPAARPSRNTVLVCRVWPGEDGPR